jgi:hypothetical protein
VTEDDIVRRQGARGREARRAWLLDGSWRSGRMIAVLRGYARTMLEPFGVHIAKTALDRLVAAPMIVREGAPRHASDGRLARKKSKAAPREAIAAIPDREYPRALADRLQLRGRHDEVVARSSNGIFISHAHASAPCSRSIDHRRRRPSGSVREEVEHRRKADYG